MPLGTVDASSLGNYTIVANSGAYPTGAQRYPGRLIFQADTQTFLWWNGAAWISLATGGGGGGGDMLRANNLSDVLNLVTARSNLGLGSAATHPSTDFQTQDADLDAIALLATASFGRGVLTQASATAARTYLGVSTGTGDLVSTNNLSDLANATTARNNLGLIDRLAPAPTGVAATDTAALISFFASLVAGDRALFPGGEYLISTGLQYKPGILYQGTGMRLDAGTRFKMANAANLDAILAPVVWYSASATPQSQSWVEWRDIYINGNGSNQTTGLGHGFVTMNFQSTFEQIWCNGCRGDGFLITNATLAGNEITNTCNEIYINRCQSRGNDGRGFHLIDAAAAAMTDGWILNCITSGNGMQGFYFESFAGWVAMNNHAYSSGRDAFRFDKPFRARIIGNYAESYGTTALLAGTYCGINLSSGFIGTGPNVVANNTVNDSATDVPANTRGGIWMQTSTGATIHVSVTGNVCNGGTRTIPSTGIRIINQAAGTTTRVTLNGNTSMGWDVSWQMGSAGSMLVAAGPGANHGTSTAQTFNATPTLNAAQAAATGGVLRMTLTANVTSSTITDGADGQRIVFKLTQDATGGRTFAWPTNVVNPPTTVTTALGVTRGEFVFDSLTTTWERIN